MELHSICYFVSSLIQHNASEILPSCYILTVVQSFLLLRSIPLYGCISLSIRVPAATLLGYFQIGGIMNEVAVNVHIPVFPTHSTVARWELGQKRPSPSSRERRQHGPLCLAIHTHFSWVNPGAHGWVIC